MKKIIVMMMLITGITRESIAQQTKPGSDDKIFEMPENFIANRISLSLGKGDTLHIELTDFGDISRLKNTDSLLAGFLKDIISFKDSLSDDLLSKRIDYVIDAAGRKKIRISTYKPQAAAFVIRQGEVSALKSQQDTISIMVTINAPAKRAMHKAFSDVRYYNLRFCLNDINDLKNYVGIGLGDKIVSAEPGGNKRWKRGAEGTWYMKNGDPAISAKGPYGAVNNSGDYISTIMGVSVQNYKSYFLPSVTLGVSLTFNNGSSKRIFGAAWEPNFLFAKDVNGKLQTYRNDFLTISYTHVTTALKPTNYIHFDPDLSISWLKRPRGDFFQKNSFRLGIGKFDFLKGHVSLEPVLYFHDFFKKATPGIRLNINF